MMKTLIHFFILFFLAVSLSQAQELSCKVTVNDRQLQTNQATEREVFREMETVFTNFMNSRKWTDDRFEEEEKINCNLVITLLRMPAVGVYEATAQIQSTRTVYGTTYETVSMNFIDQQFDYQYLPSQQVNFNENIFNDDLTSMLGFYAHVILAMHYESLAPKGGEILIQKAFNIVNAAQNSSNNGWKRAGTQGRRNRYWLIENLQNQQMLSFREGLYKYHRRGLDRFVDEPNDARMVILDVLKDIQKVNAQLPGSALTNLFFDTKSQELVNIFKNAEEGMRKEVFDILMKLDPNKGNQYRRILNQG